MIPNTDHVRTHNYYGDNVSSCNCLWSMLIYIIHRYTSFTTSHVYSYTTGTLCIAQLLCILYHMFYVFIILCTKIPHCVYVMHDIIDIFQRH